jgi:hypothetical protein
MLTLTTGKTVLQFFQAFIQPDTFQIKSFKIRSRSETGKRLAADSLKTTGTLDLNAGECCRMTQCHPGSLLMISTSA